MSGADSTRFTGSRRWFGSRGGSGAFEHGAEGFVDLDDGGPEGDEEDGGHDEEKDGEDQLDAEFAGGFLGGEFAAGANIAGVAAQGRTEAGAEAVGIDEHHGEFFEFG